MSVSMASTENKPDMTGSEYERMMGSLTTTTATGLSLAMALETGVVHVLCQADTALTSGQIAQQAGLKERYVRELLGALVAARVVQLAPGTGGRDDGVPAGYLVPEADRPVLDKTARKSITISAIARQFAAVRDIFDQDGPSCVRFNSTVLDYTDYVGPLQVEAVMEMFFSNPGLREKLERGLEVGEVGSGKGWMIRQLAAMFPNSRFVGSDVAEVPLASARRLAEEEGLTNVTFQLVDACSPPPDWHDRFDWMFAVNVIHDVPYPQKALEGVQNALKPGSVFSMADECVSSYVAENAGSATASELYTYGTFHCIPESYQQPDSEAFGPCWGEDRARKCIMAAGLQLLEIKKLPKVLSLAVFTCQKPE